MQIVSLYRSNGVDVQSKTPGGARDTIYLNETSGQHSMVGYIWQAPQPVVKLEFFLSATGTKISGRITFNNDYKESFSFESTAPNQSVSKSFSSQSVSSWTLEYEQGSLNYLQPCDDNADCPEGQKCVDGECVDCDNQAATHFRLREEYSELASIAGALVPYQLSALNPLPVTSPLEVSLENHNQLRSWWRVLFCDSNGNPAPYDGEFQINANNNYQVGTGGNVPSGNMLFGPWDNVPDIGGGGNMYISKVIVEYADESSPITEPDCSGITPEAPDEPTPPIPETPPVEPPPEEPPEIEEYPPPDEPSPPAPWPEPWEPPYTPPEKPLPPSEPETGCECEIYLGSILLQIVDSIYDSIWSAYDRLNTVFQFASGMFGSFQGICGAFLNLIYQSVMYIVNSYQIEQVRNREKISEVVDELKTFNAKFAEFADNYEPVQIENEYRTQSHRVIDNLDSTLNKL